jgi:hypothetical protein
MQKRGFMNKLEFAELLHADEQEIVGIMINKIIYTGIEAMWFAARKNGFDAFISRAAAVLMASMDLGYNWEQLAESPTLFCVDKNNKPCDGKESIIKTINELKRLKENKNANE